MASNRKAWDALAAKDWNAVEQHQIVRVPGSQCKGVNDGLSNFPAGNDAKRFSNLNELATVTFLKGEALRKVILMASAAYYTLLADYNFGQCWDQKGWWWQPASVAETRLQNWSEGSDSSGRRPAEEAIEIAEKEGCYASSEGKAGSWEEMFHEPKC